MSSRRNGLTLTDAPPLRDDCQPSSLPGHVLWGEGLRFLVVGGWNTLFGVGLFWLLEAVLGGRVHYLVLLALSNELAILQAYCGHRWIVFRSKGQIGGELLRFHLVYAGSTLAGMGFTTGLVETLHLRPALANSLAVPIVVLASFFGHRSLSFRRRKDAP